jgi:pimeloyl-ACP methyl ester carboxylesterase
MLKGNTMTFVMIDNMRMYYTEHGKPLGPPLFLLHGFTGNGDSWASQLPAFGESYRLIIPDLRGHGRTDNPGGIPSMNHRQFAHDVIGLCQSLKIERAAFCGQSTGAMLLLSLAVYAPTLPVATIHSGGTHYFGKECVAMLRKLSPETIHPEWRAYMQTAHTALGPDHWRSLIMAFHNLHTHDRLEDFPDSAELQAITTPVLLIHGDRDDLFPVEMPQELYGLLANAELCILPNTNHVPPEEHPGWFNEITLDFLARHYPDQS